MWFKNLRVYRLTEKLSYTPELLDESLAKFEFQPCGKLDPIKYGWVPPLGREGVQFVHAAGGCMMMCAKKQEKVIPSAVINEVLEERIVEINTSESRHVGRAEKQTLKDDVIFTLMPKALAKSSLDYAYIDTNHQLMIVNSSSASRAEQLISALREALGSIKLIPLTPLNPAQDVLTSWVRTGSTPKEIELGEECELKSLRDGRIIRCKNQDLTADEITQHIESGMHVTKLAIQWNNAISCIIDEEMSFKRIKYDDAIYERADDGSADSKAQQFDQDFSVMTIELAAFLTAMIHAFGGAETESPFEDAGEKESALAV